MTLAGNVRRIKDDEQFCFECSSTLDCFTECCRELELSLSPYDVLRLRSRLKLTSVEFFERHAIVEQNPSSNMPAVYLGMVDDGRASCPFVSHEGCLIYQDRPGACRTYPLGRGVVYNTGSDTESFYVLIQEEHCSGFHQKKKFDCSSWKNNQGVEIYDYMNDLLLPLNQHQDLREGQKLTERQAGLYLSVLYHLQKPCNETHPEAHEMLEQFCSQFPQHSDCEESKQLVSGIAWLKRALFKS